MSEHNPPHFHVKYQDYEAIITIKDGIITGSLPRRALRLVYEWLDLHQDGTIDKLGEIRKIRSTNENYTITIRKETIMNPILKVTGADYIRNYVLRLSFNDGTTKLVDFWPLAQKGICKKLQNMDYFRQYRLDPFSVDWSNEIGFAPEYLYEIGTPA